MDWISVKDRLPEYWANVLVYYAGDGINQPRIDVSCRMYSGRFLLEGVYGPVTHWMPLPEPPRQKEETP